MAVSVLVSAADSVPCISALHEDILARSPDYHLLCSGRRAGGSVRKVLLRLQGETTYYCCCGGRESCQATMASKQPNDWAECMIKHVDHIIFS